MKLNWQVFVEAIADGQYVKVDTVMRQFDTMEEACAAARKLMDETMCLEEINIYSCYEVEKDEEAD